MSGSKSNNIYIQIQPLKSFLKKNLKPRRLISAKNPGDNMNNLKPPPKKMVKVWDRERYPVLVEQGLFWKLSRKLYKGQNIEPCS